VSEKNDFRFNYIVNVLDGAFFGLGLGFASFSTIIPLFVSTLTSSAVLIGLVSALHQLGWQLPQLLIAGHIARQTRYKPLVIRMTLHERLPFLGLALVAFSLPTLGVTWAIVLTFLMLAWQGFGAGFTANPWQNMINKVIPNEYLATFFGVQTAAMNLMASGSALVVAYLLGHITYPKNYSLAFLLCGGILFISLIFLALNKESHHSLAIPLENQPTVWTQMVGILKTDRNFDLLLVSRILTQFGLTGAAFYAIYVSKELGAGDGVAATQASVLMISQVVFNLLLGWLADRWNRKGVLIIGGVAVVSSGIVAYLAPSQAWFYLVMILLGAAYTATFPILMAILLQFGTPENRPTYIGMANTLITPITFLVPLLAGWLASIAGYRLTFIVSSSFGVLALLILSRIRIPRKIG
jgi:MFS family permease